MNEYTIKVSTLVDDYYNIKAPTVEDAYLQVLDLILNSGDEDIIDSLAYIKGISCVGIDEDDYYE